MSHFTVSIQTEDGDFTSFSLDPSETIENLKALLEVEFRIPIHEQVLLYNGNELQNSSTLQQSQYDSSDLLLLTKRRQQRGPQTGQSGQSGQPGQTGQQDPAIIFEHIKNNPQLLNQLTRTNPRIAEAVRNNDLPAFIRIVQEEEAAKREEHLKRLQEIDRLNADPFNPENQKKIEELIKQSNIDDNMENALEHNPEAFGRVVMLFIDAEVNHTPVKVFVDSGAQSTIMSAQCAERCGIMRLVDHRFSGIAKGVGTAKIIGRVHAAYLKMGSSFFSSSFTILEDSSIDVLLGLDMLRKHQCQIDLKDNVLRTGGEAVPFLAEKDIPLRLRDHNVDPATSPSTPPSTPPATTTASGSVRTPPSTPPVSTPVPLASTPTTSPSNPGTSGTSAGGTGTGFTFSPHVSNPPPSYAQQVQGRPGYSAPPPQQQGFQEADIQTLMRLGRSRDEAISALRMFGGNVEMAASYLFSNF